MFRYYVIMYVDSLPSFAIYAIGFVLRRSPEIENGHLLHPKTEAVNLSSSSSMSLKVFTNLRVQQFEGLEKENFSFSLSIPRIMWAGIARSKQRLATGWTVRGSNPGGGEIFRTRPDMP